MDLFFTLDDVDIANFADHNISYVFRKNLDEVTESLQQTSILLLQWFQNIF